MNRFDPVYDSTQKGWIAYDNQWRTKAPKRGACAAGPFRTKDETEKAIEKLTSKGGAK